MNNYLLPFMLSKLELLNQENEMMTPFRGVHNSEDKNLYSSHGRSAKTPILWFGRFNFKSI